jgi:hypothetical protein
MPKTIFPELGDELRPDFERDAAGHGEDDHPARAESLGQLDETLHQRLVAIAAPDDEEVPLGSGRDGPGTGRGEGHGRQDNDHGNEEGAFSQFILHSKKNYTLIGGRPEASVLSSRLPSNMTSMQRHPLL